MNRTNAIITTTFGLFAVFFLFQYLTPLTSDDYGFRALLTSPSAIVTQALRQFRDWDGRIGGYILNHTLLYLPHMATAIILSITPVCLIYLMNMHALGPVWKSRLTWKHLVFTFCLLWLSIPVFGQVFFWRTGTFYSITPMLALLFLWPYRVLAERGVEKNTLYGWLVLLALPVGLSEFTTGIVTALLALLAAGLHSVKKKQCRILPFLPPVVLLICFFIMYSAPGNMRRAQMIMGDTPFSHWNTIIAHLARQDQVQSFYLWPYLLMALCAFLLWRFNNSTPSAGTGRGESRFPSWRSRLAQLFKEPSVSGATVFFLAAQAAQLAFLFAPSPAKRAYTPSIIFMIIAALTFFYSSSALLEQARSKLARWFRIFWVPAVAACFFTLCMAVIMFYQTRVFDAMCNRIIAQAGPGARLCLPPAPYPSDQYLFCGRELRVHDDPDHWMNGAFAAYHKLESVALCRQNFAMKGAAGQNTGSFNGLVTDSMLTFEYVPAPENAATPFVFAFHYPQSNPFRIYLESFLQRHLGQTRLFKRIVSNRYQKVFPEIDEVSGERILGRAAMPHLEHASTGYILHYDGDIKNIVALVPLDLLHNKPPR